MNFKKLKKLILETEKGNESTQREFYSRLKNIAIIELSLKQDNLSNYGVG